MDEKKKEKKEAHFRSFFLFLFTILLVIFFTLTIFEATGYYEFSAHKKVSLTNEQIKKFEQDIAEGRDVRMEDYLEYQNKNYSNKLSKLGYHFSSGVAEIVKNVIRETVGRINQWVQN